MQHWKHLATNFASCTLQNTTYIDSGLIMTKVWKVYISLGRPTSGRNDPDHNKWIWEEQITIWQSSNWFVNTLLTEDSLLPLPPLSLSLSAGHGWMAAVLPCGTLLASCYCMTQIVWVYLRLSIYLHSSMDIVTSLNSIPQHCSAPAALLSLSFLFFSHASEVWFLTSSPLEQPCAVYISSKTFFYKDLIFFTLSR